MGAPDRLYEQDFFAWTQEQAKALREIGQGPGSNLPLDWENLAEEIESLGKADRSALRSHIRRILLHLLKLQFSPASEPHRGWEDSIDDSRDEINDLLGDSPSLKREVPSMIREQFPQALKRAVRDLLRHGERDAAATLKAAEIDYTEDQVLGPWFPGDPLGGG